MRGLWAYTAYQYQSNKKYQMNNMMTILSTFIAVSIQYYIWLFVEKTNGIRTEQIIIYTMFALTLSSVLPMFSAADFMNRIILKGTIANYLQRPQLPFFVNVAVQLGNTWYKIVYRIIPIWVIYIFFFRINIFEEMDSLFWALLSLTLSWILAMILGHVIGLFSTFLMSINGTKSLLSGCLLLFGGGVLPIDIYPEFLRKFVLKLPFVAIQYFPSAMLSGSQLFYYKDAIFVQQNRQQSLMWIAIVLGSQFVLYMLRQIFFRLDYTTSNKTWHLYELKLAERMLNAKYEAIERQEFLDLHQKAARYVAGFGAGFGAVLRQGFQILGQLVTLIGLAAIIFTLHPIVIMALVAIVVVQTILLNKGLKPVRNFQIDQSVIERRADYFNKRINDFQYGKEIRNYNLNKWFLGKFKEQLARVFEFYKKIGNANLKLGFYSISGLVLQLFVSYYYLFRQSFLGLVTVGSFTMYLSAISTFFDTLSQIIMNVLQINQFKVLFKAYKIA